MLFSSPLPSKAVPCDFWKGPRDKHQYEARNAFGIVPAFTWITTTCGNTTCLTREHLAARRPLSLAYPHGLCIYCGLTASDMDHLLPVSYTGAGERIHVVTVPACRECNSGLTDTFAPNITERRAIAHDRIRTRHAKWLRVHPYTAKQIAEFGPNLRSAIAEGVRMREITEKRLTWPGGPHYDIRACQDAGIEDPYAVGMLTRIEEAA